MPLKSLNKKDRNPLNEASKRRGLPLNSKKPFRISVERQLHSRGRGQVQPRSFSVLPAVPHLILSQGGSFLFLRDQILMNSLIKGKLPYPNFPIIPPLKRRNKNRSGALNKKDPEKGPLTKRKTQKDCFSGMLQGRLPLREP